MPTAGKEKAHPATASCGNLLPFHDLKKQIASIAPAARTDDICP
jgi:hypothetical protein